MKKYLGSLAAAGLLFTACSEPVEFNALDAEGLAVIVDAGMTEESGLKGLITADLFSVEDVTEFNGLAEEACAELADGISAEDYDELEAGVLDGAQEMRGMIDADAMTLALVNGACPAYADNLTSAMAG